jgi:hypothetical protein
VVGSNYRIRIFIIFYHHQIFSGWKNLQAQDRHVSHMTETRNAYKIQRKRIHGRPRHGWKDNIKVNFKEMKCELAESIYVCGLG